MGKKKQAEPGSAGSEEFVIKMYRGSRGWRVGVGEFSKSLSRNGLLMLAGEFRNLAEAELAGKRYWRELWVY